MSIHLDKLREDMRKFIDSIQEAKNINQENRVETYLQNKQRDIEDLDKFISAVIIAPRQS
jgi:hypothetical protein